MSIYDGLHHTDEAQGLSPEERRLIFEDLPREERIARGNAHGFYALGDRQMTGAMLQSAENKRQQQVSLMEHIQNSRVKQKQLTHEWDFKERQLSEQISHRKAQSEEVERHHRADELRHLQSMAQADRHHQESLASRAEKKARLNPTEFKTLKEASNGYSQGEELLKELDAIEKMSKSLDTGYLKGKSYSMLGPYAFGTGKEHDLSNEFKTLSDDILVKAHQTMKNIPRSEAFVQRLEQIKPSLSNTKSANKQSITQIRSETKRAMAHHKQMLGYLSHNYDLPTLSEPLPESGADQVPDLSKMSDEELRKLAQ